jgi:type I restriction enzyme S subunit
MTSQTLRQSSKVKKTSSSWRVMTLGEIGEIVSGGTPSTAVPEYWGGDINWISPSDLTGYKKKTIKKGAKSITELGLKNSSARIIPKGSVLFSSRAPIGYVAIAADDVSTNQGFKSIIPYDFVISEYLYYFLTASKQAAEEVASGTTFKEISKSTFSELKIPIPDKTTQQAIVSKIEELFSELDKGIESLRMAQQQLKVYRQSVLKWAFEGRLTNEDVKEGEFPEGWKIVNIDFLLSQETKGMSTGPFGTMLKKHEHKTKGVPVLGIENIGEGKFQMPNKIFVSEAKAKELRNFTVKENDIIISRSGTVGEICCIPKKMENSIISTNLIKVSLNKRIINPKLFVYLFQGGDVRQQVFDLCKGSSRAFLNQTILKSLSIPYCEINEQDAIIDTIESRLSMVEKMDESINQNLLQAEALRQSILKRAFEGKLMNSNKLK